MRWVVQEVDAAASVIGETDAWLICPFFLQGGRYTIDDVHYVADGNNLVPAGQTEFAQDAVFGYQASNLREWVEEKTQGRWVATNVHSVSIETLRKGGPSVVCQQLCSLPSVCMYICMYVCMYPTLSTSCSVWVGLKLPSSCPVCFSFVILLHKPH
jgi:hypothetical protein